MTCKDCIHDGICTFNLTGNERIDCFHFKNKTDVVEVDTIKAWLYEMAINNVGCDGDFSKACEEIISRIDGLRNFAKERSENND